MNIKDELSTRIEAAFAKVGLEGAALVQLSGKPEFGDYQSNGVMAAAKRASKNPREAAAEVIDTLDLEGIASTVEIAGPGFINITLAPEFLANAAPGDVNQAREPQTVVVDYSAPNLAKEMHVGHLRSTIIGEAVCRTVDALVLPLGVGGHHLDVLGRNHSDPR